MTVSNSYIDKTTEYFKNKGASINDSGYVGYKDIMKVLKINKVTIESYLVPPACIYDDWTYKIHVSYLPWITSTCMNRNVKRPELRKAFREYMDFIGMPYVDIWKDTMFYIILEVKSGKVKVGNTDTHIRTRIVSVDRYMDRDTREMEVLLLIDSLGDDTFKIEMDAKKRFSHLSTGSPDNPRFASGKGEWFTYGDAVKKFVRDYSHLNVKDRPEHSIDSKHTDKSSSQILDELNKQNAELQAQIDLLSRQIDAKSK